MGRRRTSVSRGEPSATVRNPPENACGIPYAVSLAERKAQARKHCSGRVIPNVFGIYCFDSMNSDQKTRDFGAWGSYQNMLRGRGKSYGV